MGDHTIALQHSVERQMKKQLPREEAFRRIRVKLVRSAYDSERKIQTIIDLADGEELSEHDKNRIARESQDAMIERNKIRDLDELEDSDWAT